MQLNRILSPERTLCDAHGTSKKRLLETLAQFIANEVPALDSEKLFSALMARERLGSTGLGNGIAIPHCRLESFDQTVGALVKLDQAIEFDALDDNPIDLLFVLIVPEHANNEHLEVLATLAELFGKPELCDKLRQTTSSESLYNTLIEFEQQLAA